MSVQTLFNSSSNLLAGILLVVAMMTAQGAAAQQSNVLRPAQTGSIQQLRQDDGYLVISGARYGYDAEIVQVTLGGEPVDAAFLSEGLVVRFVTDREGNLVSMEMLGPIDKIREFQEN